MRCLYHQDERKQAVPVKLALGLYRRKLTRDRC